MIKSSSVRQFLGGDIYVHAGRVYVSGLCALVVVGGGVAEEAGDPGGPRVLGAQMLGCQGLRRILYGYFLNNLEIERNYAFHTFISSIIM